MPEYRVEAEILGNKEMGGIGGFVFYGTVRGGGAGGEGGE